MMRAMKSRLDQTLPVGNEGAGTVVATGDSEEARALDGKLVAMLPRAAMPNMFVCRRKCACPIMTARQRFRPPHPSSIR